MEKVPRYLIRCTLVFDCKVHSNGTRSHFDDGTEVYLFIFCHEMLYLGFFLDVQFSHRILLFALLFFQMTCVEVQFQSVLFKNTSETYLSRDNLHNGPIWFNGST